MPEHSFLRQFFTRNTFRKEILTAILLKIVALLILFGIFSVIEKESPTTRHLAQHFFD